MTQRSTHHATFVIERTYPASPARVFKAFADAAAKAHWFVGPDDWQSSDHELDFRVGGREHVSGGYDNSADREHGTVGLLDNLDAALRREGAIA